MVSERELGPLLRVHAHSVRFLLGVATGPMGRPDRL
jgi:hypothetical protein